MKKLLLSAIFLLGAGMAYAQHGYWYHDTFIELRPKTTSTFFVYQKENSLDLSLKDKILGASKQCRIDYMYDDNRIVVSSTTVPEFEGVYISNIFTSGNGDWYIILPRLEIKTEQGFDIKSIIKKYKDVLSIESELGEIYKIKCSVNRAEDVLDIANDLHSRSEVIWCNPEKMSNTEVCSSNSWSFYQYFLNNTNTIGMDINVEPAWDIITGSSDVTISVIDQGVDFDHPEMSNCVLEGYTVGNVNGYGLPQNANNLNVKAHGVACAGIIAAENNSFGVTGVSYGSNILPVNIFPYTASVNNNGSASDLQIADAIRWAGQRADILNLSWVANYSQSIEQAIYDVRVTGRNGKGAVVVCAAGNDYLGNSSTVAFPAILYGVIAVGALDQSGNVCTYSQRGGGLSLMAFGGDEDIVTTDRKGSLGYNSDNYIFTFDGTSAACSQVTGVAALMLSVNPALTESQVRANLNKTCKKLSGYNYDAYGWNNQVGYGLVDAEAAVIASLRVVGPDIPCGSTSYYVDLLPNTYSVSWSWKNACSVPITQNTPTTNHCTITRNDNQYFGNTLVATISKNGNIITTVEKVLDTGANFSGTYQQAAAPLMNIPAIGPTTFHNGQTIMLMLGSTITLKSPKFVGANISYSGYTPFYWSHNDSTIIIRHFAFPYNNPKDLIITGTYSGNCEAFQFILQLSEPASVFPHASINIIPVGLGYAFELCANMMSDDSTETYSSIKLSGWHMTIANALTGKIMFDEDIEGTQKIVSTTNWEAGIYVINARIGDNIITRKFQISRD